MEREVASKVFMIKDYIDNNDMESHVLELQKFLIIVR